MHFMLQCALYLGLCIPPLISLADERPPLLPDTLGIVATLPAEPGAHWIWVSDMVWIAMTDGRATLIDADSGKMLGMLSTGYSFNSLSIPRRYGEIYSAETYYSRYTRGKRTDVVSVYDTKNLLPVAEIIIPPKRASTTPKLSSASLTDDDRFLAIWNFTPAQSLSIVDVKQRTFVAEIQTPGCALAYPAGARHYFTLCGNGTVQLIRLDENGQLLSKTDSKRFFDLQDPITEKGVRRGQSWYFPSYNNVIHQIDIQDGKISFPPPWSMVSQKDQRESWRIGGIQHLAIHGTQARLYALMHQGPTDSHHQPGTEVWVYDLDTKKRVRRIVLQRAAASIEVSQDDAPLLYTVNPDIAELVVYDARSGKHQRTIAEVSITPSLLQLPGGLASGHQQ